MGEPNEDVINHMSFVWFNEILAALGKRLNFDSLSHLYGNSFAKDAGDIINSLNPLVKFKKMSMFDGLDVTIEKDKAAEDEAEDMFSDISAAFAEQQTKNN